MFNNTAIVNKVEILLIVLCCLFAKIHMNNKRL